MATANPERHHDQKLQSQIGENPHRENLSADLYHTLLPYNQVVERNDQAL